MNGNEVLLVGLKLVVWNQLGAQPTWFKTTQYTFIPLLYNVLRDTYILFSFDQVAFRPWSIYLISSSNNYAIYGVAKYVYGHFHINGVQSKTLEGGPVGS